MKSSDLWLVGFVLRCCAVLFIELASFAYLIPTLFNLHNDAANVVAALIAVIALGGGYLATITLGREIASSSEKMDD
ncbi:MAG: hypothetical protein WC804_06600 [Sphingomonas sp.]|uniref:hypothetical protein n=1 Tax=Sphingomonas sp. TaxID=28214 RepID=UPI00356A57FC